MRIIHLSDIHLSSNNIEDLRLHYLNSLTSDLKNINKEKEIDLIIISGDLLDKGGFSLLTLDEYNTITNPYDIFEKEFIFPICENLPFIKEKIIFIPGNHDIDRKKIDEVIEAGLISLLTNTQKVNETSNKYIATPNMLGVDRIEKYLDFEEKYHKKNSFLSYKFSYLESKVIYNYKGSNIGIALINDTWRCSNNKVVNHFIGTNQFHKSIQHFNQNKTLFNIAVMHHPLECMNQSEKEEIENILHNFSFEILIIGHEHKTRVQKSDIGNNKTVLYTRGKSAFDKPHETHRDYISGYSYIDIDLDEKLIICNFRIYDKNNFKFENELQHGTSKKEFTYGIPEKKLKEDHNKKEKFVYDFDKNNFINNSEDEE
jgi:DNA repair exonuclease SbcCD nuclease subunit